MYISSGFEAVSRESRVDYLLQTLLTTRGTKPSHVTLYGSLARIKATSLQEGPSGGCDDAILVLMPLTKLGATRSAVSFLSSTSLVHAPPLGCLHGREAHREGQGVVALNKGRNP
ncbi:unnamed protein product [Musa acuminata subsp. burmannicoides]